MLNIIILSKQTSQIMPSEYTLTAIIKNWITG